MKFSMLCFYSHSLLLVFVFSVNHFTNAAPNSSSEQCDETKPACLKQIIQTTLPSFVKGIPELGTEVLDPFYIDKLNFTLAGGLQIQFRDGQAKGLRKCVVERARVMQDIIETQYTCNLVIIGKYSSSGRLLMFPINGDGDAVIKCKNVRIASTLKVKSVPGPAATHLEVVSASTNHSFDGRIQYNLTNLFKGSPEISKMVLEFINQNWRMVAQEFGDPIVEFGVEIIHRNIKKLFSVVPMNHLFPTWNPIPSN